MAARARIAALGGARDAGDAGNAGDADATASTLNHALGRRAMKSWMMAPVNASSATPSHLTANITKSVPSIFRRRGGPAGPISQHVENQQHATETASPPSAPSAERLPSSNSTSPQLANVVTAQQSGDSHGNVDIAGFPSPTPSEEDRHTRATRDEGTRARQTVSIDGLRIAAVQSPSVPGTPQQAIATSAERENPSAVKRPAGEALAPVEKRVCVDSAPQERRVPANTASPVQQAPQSIESPEILQRPSAPYIQQGGPFLGRLPSHSPSLGQQSHGLMASTQLVQAAHQWGRPSSSHSNTSPVQGHYIWNPPSYQIHVDPSLGLHSFASTPNAQTAWPHHVIPSHQRASHHRDWYSHGVCRGVLNAFKASYSATAGYPRDRERLQVLDEAVEVQDWPYVTLHQYYCLLTRWPQSLPPSLRHNKNLATAYGLMRDVLDDNAQLSAPVLDFFCNFPFSIERIAETWPTSYQLAEREFVMFVDCSAMVGSLRRASEKRRVPPTPREFADCAITSKTFQHLFLRSIIRSFWAGYLPLRAKHRLEDRILHVWDHELSTFQQQQASGQLGDRKQAEDELRTWTFLFTKYTSGLKAELQNHQPRNPQHQLQHQTQHQPQHQPQHHPQHHPQYHPQHLPQQPNTTSTPTAVKTAMSRRQQLQSLVVQHRTISQTHLSPLSRLGLTTLLPRPGVYQPQQRVPNPSRFGLHQAHLRSPILQAPGLASPAYYFWQGFVHKPQRFANSNKMVEKLSFVFAEKGIEFVAKAIPSAPGAPEERVIAENDKTIRLRCVKWISDEEPKDDTWAVAENSWIPHAYFAYNGSALQLRKKLHNGKDLPVDLTGLAQKGENVLEVSVMSNLNDTTHRNYLVAIEYMGIMTHATIRKRCHENQIPAQKAIEDIKRKLSISNTDDDDDDIAIVESTLTINIRDPFSASKLCDTPVRSTACLHNECFDLDTFLQTRPRKGGVSAADQWRCPICKVDARPSVLFVDGFLVEVRKELEKQGLLETRAITVDQDGSWKPKLEERDPNGVQDRDNPEPASTSTPAATRFKPPVAHEIIDLDSD